jgi:hypothetical protein
MSGMRFSRTVVILSVGLVVAACNSPQRRSSGLTLPSGASVGNGTVSGSLTTFSSGQAVGGATVKLGSVSAISDASGGFQLIGTPEAGTAIITASTNGYIFRGVALSLSSSKPGTQLDLIRDAAPFSFTFYREFARNALEGSQLELLKRWTVNPSFYFQQITTDPVNPVRVPDDIVAAMQANILKSVPEISGGRFSVAAFDKGDGPKDPTDGWVNVLFYNALRSDGILGFSTVGGNQGTINVQYNTSIDLKNKNANPYACSSISLQVIDHEIIHTMGFWHTETTLTDEFSGNGCPGVGRPAVTRVVRSFSVGGVTSFTHECSTYEPASFLASNRPCPESTETQYRPCAGNVTPATPMSAE